MSVRLAVIFDMDGVLVDSYHAHYESWQKAVATVGRTMSPDQFDATFGRTSREIVATLWPEMAADGEKIAWLDAFKEAAYREILGQHFHPMPGVEELLESLQAAGFALGIGSSGPPENVELVLDRLQGRKFFSAVVSGMDVTRGKPDPQVFLLAAERLGIAPRYCAVVEDAPLGITAAQNAGMASVGLVSTGRSRQALKFADLVVDSLAELSPTVFRDLIGRVGFHKPQ